MRILVVGGAGFLGSHLVNHLLNFGHNIWIIDNLSTGKKENLPKNGLKNFFQIDLRKKDILNFAVRIAKPEFIFCLADFGGDKISERCPSLVVENNFNGSLNLLSATIRQKVKKFIFLSPIGYSHSVYRLTKLYFENIIKILSYIYKFEYLILRFPPVYGPKMALHDPYKERAESLFREVYEGKRQLDDPEFKKCIFIKDFIEYITEDIFSDKTKNDIIHYSPKRFNKDDLMQTWEWVKNNYPKEMKYLPYSELSKNEK